jgi:hypothetical protein
VQHLFWDSVKPWSIPAQFCLLPYHGAVLLQQEAEFVHPSFCEWTVELGLWFGATLNINEGNCFFFFIYVCVHTCAYACSHVYEDICIFIHMCMCACLCVCVCVPEVNAECLLQLLTIYGNVWFFGVLGIKVWSSASKIRTLKCWAISLASRVCVCVCVCVCVLYQVYISQIVRWQLFFFKIYLFYIYEYTVDVYRHTRSGHQIPLQMVVSHHVVAGNWTQDLWKSSQCS